MWKTHPKCIGIWGWSPWITARESLKVFGGIQPRRSAEVVVAVPFNQWHQWWTSRKFSAKIPGNRKPLLIMLIYACFIGFILIFAGHLILFARSLTTPEFFTPSKFIIEPLNRAMSWPCQVVESFVTHLFHFPCHDTTLKWVGVSPNVESPARLRLGAEKSPGWIAVLGTAALPGGPRAGALLVHPGSREQQHQRWGPRDFLQWHQELFAAEGQGEVMGVEGITWNNIPMKREEKLVLAHTHIYGIIWAERV